MRDRRPDSTASSSYRTSSAAGSAPRAAVTYRRHAHAARRASLAASNSSRRSGSTQKRAYDPYAMPASSALACRGRSHGFSSREQTTSRPSRTMCTTRACGKARSMTAETCASSGVCSTARTEPTSPTRRATARILRRRRAASSESSAASSGTAALTGATSPRSTKPGNDPIAPARNVVPERGDPITNTSRSSSLPSRSRRDAPRRGASRFATRSWRAAESSRLGTARFSQAPTIDTPRVLVDSVGTTRDGTQRRAGLKR